MVSFLLVGILFFSLNGMFDNPLAQGIAKEKDKFFPVSVDEYFKTFGGAKLTQRVVEGLKKHDSSKKTFLNDFVSGFFFTRWKEVCDENLIPWFGSERIKCFNYKAVREIEDPCSPLFFDYICGVPLEKDGAYGKARRNFFLQENSLLKFGSIYANKEIQDFLSSPIKEFNEHYSIGFPLFLKRSSHNPAFGINDLIKKKCSNISSFDILPASFLIDSYSKIKKGTGGTMDDALNLIVDPKDTLYKFPTVSGPASLRNSLLSLYYFFDEPMNVNEYFNKVTLPLQGNNDSLDDIFVKNVSLFYSFQSYAYYFQERCAFPELVKFLENKQNEDHIIKTFEIAITAYETCIENDISAINIKDTALINIYSHLERAYAKKFLNNKGFNSKLVEMFLQDIKDACQITKKTDYCSFERKYFNNNDIFAHIRGIQMGLYHLSCINRDTTSFSVFFNKVPGDKRYLQFPFHFNEKYINFVRNFFNDFKLLQRLNMEKLFLIERLPFQLNEDFLFHCLEVTTKQYCDRDHQVYQDDCVFCQHALEYNKGIQKKIEHIDGIFTMFFGEEHGYASLVRACLSNNPYGITFDKNNGISLTPKYRKDHGIHQLSSPLCMETFSSTMALYAARMKVIEEFLMDEQKKITDAEKFFKEKDKEGEDVETFSQITTAFTQELQRVHNLSQCFSGEDLTLYKKEFLSMDESSENHELYDGMLKSIFYETGFENISLAPATLLLY